VAPHPSSRSRRAVLIRENIFAIPYKSKLRGLKL
jgi:hypothetical protein